MLTSKSFIFNLWNYTNKNHKSWNTGSHRRKFMLANGKYVENEELKDGNLMFWGEWESPSQVRQLNQQSNKLLPKWLHSPYIPKELPVSMGYQESFQNTDPYIFGESFKYFICKQFKPKSKRETQLASLEKGSIILFGSTKGRARNEAFFGYHRHNSYYTN